MYSYWRMSFLKNNIYISKDDFVEALVNIKASLDTLDDFNDTMDKFMDGYCIITIADKPIATAIRLLEMLVGDERDRYGSTISWWIYEEVEKVLTVDGVEIDVSTPEKLYDYFVSLS